VRRVGGSCSHAPSNAHGSAARTETHREELMAGLSVIDGSPGEPSAQHALAAEAGRARNRRRGTPALPCLCCSSAERALFPFCGDAGGGRSSRATGYWDAIT
jgi:hypothetical protein